MNPFANRRAHMVDILRRQGIRSAAVLDALREVPREVFVPDTLQSYAYDNRALPIEAGQTISQPFIVGYMTEQLQLAEDHKVLEVGTGSGYQAAVLAALCRRIYTIERKRELLAIARRRFDALGLETIISRVGDGTRGWPEQAPFDRIIVTAAAPQLPLELTGQLADGGRMVVPVGPDGGDQTMMLVTRHGGQFEQRDLLPVRFVPLVSARRVPAHEIS